MWVGCGECGTRYDDATFTFCPRCGSTRRVSEAAATPSVATAVARHAAARRLQGGGAILLLLGLLCAGLAGFGLGPGFGGLEEGVGTILAAGGTLPGGDLRLQVTADGAPIAANVTLRSGNETFLSRETDGWLNASLGTHGAATLQVTAAGRTVERNLLVLEGTTEAVRVDVLRDASSAAWPHLAELLRVILGLLLGTGLLLSAGGLAALVRRARWVAYLAPAPALVLALFLATGTFSLGAFALAAVVAVGYGLVVAGRAAFR